MRFAKMIFILLYMIKKIFITFFIIFLAINSNARADGSSRGKALGTMALYGTIGGALLGTASLAFGASGRSVAIGASLGLYSGLLFGGYVVGSHEMMKRKYKGPKESEEQYYPDTEGSPYEDQQSDVYDPGYNQGSNDAGPADHGLSKKDQSRPGQTYYVQLLNYQF